ncbi:hypothetical protein Poli38472_001002 [Pythium oligandrum]|uniref:Uncharacterized protein n=1 Tax=Pythium oligandrum TaxID=41045 RepID=A0A8K1FEV7_PYTOL|nr:hypothetical protein Poli38472_001002 [Pythium oligandrum]|eukprot:TMW60960.1 hypothetical protein Poli38472_001002 [Pythium oligandrum]
MEQSHHQSLHAQEPCEEEPERDVGEELEEEEDDNELHIAARAGIRLLEENMHFREEVLQLQEQIARLRDEKHSLEHTVTEKDTQISSLSTRLRESILDNQRVLSELNQTQDQVRQLEDSLQQQQRSPRRRSSSRRASPRRRNGSLSLALEPSDAVDSSKSPTRDADECASPVPMERRRSSTQLNGDSPQQQAPPSTPGSSPRRRQTLVKLREAEAKFEEEFQRASSLRVELISAQKKIGELKPLHGQLLEARQEIEMLRSQVSVLERREKQYQEELTEGGELIQSLQSSIEAYQRLHELSTVESKAQESRLPGTLAQTSSSAVGTDDHVATRGNTPGPVKEAESASQCTVHDWSLRDESERITALADQVLTLKMQENIIFMMPKPQSMPETTEATPTQRSVESCVGPIALGSCSRQRYLEQQIIALQDLLKRFRFEWKLAHDALFGLEREKHELLQQIDRLQAQVDMTVTKQHEAEFVECNKLSPEESTDEARQCSNAIYEALFKQAASVRCSSTSGLTSKEDELDAELLCFALLRRLVDSWTTDKPKRMRLHDWLINAIRQTGIRKPLYLHELSTEIAAGFQTIMVPILEERFGVRVNVEKRLRSVVLTDLRIQVLANESSSSRTAQRQQVHQAFLSMIDAEDALFEGKESWCQPFSRRAVVRNCLS